MTPSGITSVLRRYCVGIVFAGLVLPDIALAQDDSPTDECYALNDTVEFCGNLTPWVGILPEQGGDPGLYYSFQSVMFNIFPAKEYGGDEEPDAIALAIRVVTRVVADFDGQPDIRDPEILQGSGVELVRMVIAGNRDGEPTTLVVLIPKVAGGTDHLDTVAFVSSPVAAFDMPYAAFTRDIAVGFRPLVNGEQVTGNTDAPTDPGCVRVRGPVVLCAPPVGPEIVAMPDAPGQYAYGAQTIAVALSPAVQSVPPGWADASAARMIERGLAEEAHLLDAPELVAVPGLEQELPEAAQSIIHRRQVEGVTVMSVSTLIPAEPNILITTTAPVDDGDVLIYDINGRLGPSAQAALARQVVALSMVRVECGDRAACAQALQ